MTQIVVSGVTDFAALGRRWRELETRAEPSFFQSWTWMGCLAEERFTDPVLVEAREDGRAVALGLFNRRRSRMGQILYLGEAGQPSLDRPYIEYNGLLTEAGREATLTRACLANLRRPTVMSGIDDATLAAAQAAFGVVRVEQSRRAPFADLAAIRAAGGDILAHLGANTRQQIRRSDRAYGESGTVTIERAATVEQAHAFLESMVPLHQATWQARGEPGCFADPFFGRFHHALIDRGMKRGEIDLFRIAAGPVLVGILYNFRFRGRSLAYQSGFAYPGPESRRKPGMTSHRLAMDYLLKDGVECYDFLAGDDRYKRVLSDGATDLHWIEAGPRLSVVGLRSLLDRWRRRI